MIEWRGFTFSYPGADRPSLTGVELDVDEGELALVVGATGSGKSTLLRSVNGLVPHFTGGHVEGGVRVAGLDPRDHPPRELASTVGMVGQDPLAGFVTDTVEEELAYGMEQLGVRPATMRRRVEEVLDLLGIAPLRRRVLRTLSGGEQQRVAIGAVLTMHPRVLVLDEPTSALDPAAAEEALSAVLRLVHDVGVTALAAEHRLERVVEYADRLVVVEDDAVRDGAPRDVLRTSPVVPPVVELGRLAGWDPLPLSVREARRAAASLRAEPPLALAAAHSAGAPADGVIARGVVVRHGDVVAVRGVDLAVSPGEVVALMGRNGSGKSSLLWALQGAGRLTGGSVRVAGQDPTTLGRRDAAALVTLVPQQATDLLCLDRVDAELAAADTAGRRPSGTTRTLLDRLTGTPVRGSAHPRDLSEGQRLALALAVQLSPQPRVVLLDEPTRGLDYRAKARLGEILTELAEREHAVLVATHDVEFVASAASRVVVLAEGDVVTDAPARQALADSPVFAPQVAKVLAPHPVLTVEQATPLLRARHG
ncbi:MAG: Duplicated ATPase component CbrU of energizing module of predicted cobalamin ECF transporter [uncultured Nocardioidaceae bacterium]|uniref:Duplicated ATPase component CbrU of energizing module of predicted cobalamin ECF transporter n=1 Tax=uncultured Nocardioidaceae bacterium TaxID=253824 RepID=A0A6J4L800_9ACTN|nr:MAG: Duplicated ATPase component CbrU of energizing module of predicted cobalamin ECF transporter [uncultured Nocardioidaceae bacterium]